MQEQGGKCFSPSLGHPKEFAETFSDHQAERYRSFKLFVWGNDQIWRKWWKETMKKRGLVVEQFLLFTIYICNSNYCKLDSSAWVFEKVITSKITLHLDFGSASMHLPHMLALSHIRFDNWYIFMCKWCATLPGIYFSDSVSSSQFDADPGPKFPFKCPHPTGSLWVKVPGFFSGILLTQPCPVPLNDENSSRYWK